MAVDGCGRLVKCLLLVFNLIVAVGGIAVLAIGIYTVTDDGSEEIANIIGSSVYESVSYVLIVIGILTFIIGLFGCWGAWKEVKCMLLSYFILLLLIFFVLLVCGILGFVYKDQILGELDQKMRSTIQDNYGVEVKGDNINSKNKIITDAWDQVQRLFKCCAVGKDTIPADSAFYQNSQWCATSDSVNKPRPPGPCVPLSCCGLPESSAGSCDTTANPIYVDGCYDEFHDYLSENAVLIGGIIGIAFCLLLGAIASIILYKQVD